MCYDLEYFLLSGSIKKFDDSILEQTKKFYTSTWNHNKNLTVYIHGLYRKLPDDFGKSLENIFYTQEMFIIYLCPRPSSSVVGHRIHYYYYYFSNLQKNNNHIFRMPVNVLAIQTQI